MATYEYYPNEESFDFDSNRSDKAPGNCPGCDKQSLRVGSCGQMDSGALIKCGECGWNCDHSQWCETEMHRLRAENERLREWGVKCRYTRNAEFLHPICRSIVVPIPGDRWVYCPWCGGEIQYEEE